MSIRVLIADDHEIMRMGLAALLETDGTIEVAGEAADGVEGAFLRRLPPEPDRLGGIWTEASASPVQPLFIGTRQFLIGIDIALR